MVKHVEFMLTRFRTFSFVGVFLFLVSVFMAFESLGNIRAVGTQ